MDISAFKDFVIVVTSDEPYSKMWHTQLIYTEFLSKDHTVFYINPPKRWRFNNIFKTSLNGCNENKNLVILNYINKFPAFFRLFSKWNEVYNERKIARELAKVSAKNVMVWHFDSYRNSFSNFFFDRTLKIKRIYHVIDPFYKNPIDRWLCEAADTVIITSPRNNKFYSDFYKKIINVAQALDIPLQKNLINAKPNLIPKAESEYFLLLGTISDDIDFEWLLNLLNNKDFNLVVIGKKIGLNKAKTQAELLFSHPRVEYMGLLSPPEFYPILKYAKAGLIIYNEERRSKVCSPLKALNYIMADLPVIANIDCEIPELLSSCIYYCDNIMQANILVGRSLNNELIFNNDKCDGYISEISLDIVLKKILAKL
jgi:hypothetical protein